MGVGAHMCACALKGTAHASSVRLAPLHVHVHVAVAHARAVTVDGVEPNGICTGRQGRARRTQVRGVALLFLQKCSTGGPLPMTGQEVGGSLRLQGDRQHSAAHKRQAGTVGGSCGHHLPSLPTNVCSPCPPFSALHCNPLPAPHLCQGRRGRTCRPPPAGWTGRWRGW